MIDIHCHILPGIDDGPETLDESIEMCRIAAADGIQVIVATPHFRPGKYEWGTIVDRIKVLHDELVRLGIGIQIVPGADVTVTPELPRYLQQHPALTIGGKGKHVLAELPHEVVPARWAEFLLSLKSSGITAIVTHPERNRWFLSHPDALNTYVLHGGMVQITAMSILGESGGEAMEYSKYLLKRRMVHAIATDAHSIDQRPPRLSEAVKAAAAVVGMDEASRLVQEIPQRIIAGQSIEPFQPYGEGPRKRKWYQRVLDL